MTTPDGLKANAAAFLGVLGAGGGAGAGAAGVRIDEALGMFAGSGTSTATLQAIIATFQGDGAAVGYSVAYPFGVAGPILCIYALKAILKPKIEQPANQVIELAEITVHNSEFVGQRLPALAARLPPGVAIAAIRRAHHNQLAVRRLYLARRRRVAGNEHQS